MSQSGLLNTSSGPVPPSVAQSYVTDSGTAVPALNILNVLGGEGIDTSGSVATITISGEDATAAASAGLANKGISSYDSASFTITAGFVQLANTSTNINKIAVDTNLAPGTNPVLPTASGQITITGAQVSAGVIGTNAIQTDSLAANTLTIQIQQAGATGAVDQSRNGIASFDSARFTVNAGFVSLNGSGGFIWSDTSGVVTAVAAHGYFVTAATTSTLPATPSEGDTVRYIVDTASALTITAAGTQKIRVGNTLSAAGGTCVNTQQGDAIEFVYRTTGTTWFAANNPVGAWTTT
jgi:hypothetical protein